VFASGSELDRGLLDEYRLKPVQPLNLPLIFTGTGQAGSALHLAAASMSGTPFAFTTTMVDMAGNWIAVFPMAQEPRAATSDQFSISDLPGSRGIWHQSALSDYRGAMPPSRPFTLDVSYGDPTPYVDPHSIQAAKLSFDGSYLVRTQFNAQSDSGPSPMPDLTLHSLAWNKFAREFTAELLSRR
jgi:hypothetical protein